MRIWTPTSGGLGAARTGVLQLGDHCPPLPTPCLLLSTRKGLPAFVSSDLLRLLHPDACALQVLPIHFLDNPSAQSIEALGGVHKLISLHDYGVFALGRDSLICEPDGEGTTKLGASFGTFCGRRVVNPKQYMELTKALKPNIWATLGDEVPASVLIKRNRLSVDRTLQWLDECLALNSEGIGAVFGTIVGAASIEERTRSAQETAKRNLEGFSLAGFGLGEDREERNELLKAAIAHLPEQYPRHVTGLGTPEDVLQAVSVGVDIFDSIYPHTLTVGGYAMTFSVLMDDVRKIFSLEDAANRGEDSSKINLRSPYYKYDTSPLLDNCMCETCRRHTKAYINHLLGTHEMLAQILLDTHNIHHYLCFFNSIREAIKGGYFIEYRNWFISQRRFPAFESFVPLSSPQLELVPS